MGFWQALSALAPVAPAMSDAQDIRTQRTQDAAKFASDEQLKQAQLTAQKLAAQGEQQRIKAGSQPMFKQGSEPEFDPIKGAYTQPAWNADKGVYEPIVVPGVSPDVQQKYQLDSFKRNRAAAKALLPPDTSDENVDYVAYTLSGMKPPPAAKFTQLSGAAGQVQTGPDGKNYVYGKDAYGNLVAQPAPAGLKPPAPKPQSPATQYTNLLAKQIMANNKQGPPLTNEEAAQLKAAGQELTLNGEATARARAIENARYGVTNVTDDDGAEVAQSRLNVVNAANSGAPMASGTQGQATAKDKSNAMLAQSAIQQVNRMQAILKADPGLVGPGGGQLTRLQMFLGNQSPDAQQFLISSLLGSEHGVAVFGGRNIHTINDLNEALGSMKTNPAALDAALQVVKETMGPFANAGGRLPGPTGAGGGGSPAGTVTLHAGGKIYHIPRDKVAEFKKDNPDARQ